MLRSLAQAPPRVLYHDIRSMIIMGAMMWMSGLGCEETTIPPLTDRPTMDQALMMPDQGLNDQRDVEIRSDAGGVDEGIVIDMRSQVEPPLIPVEVVLDLGLERTPAGVANRLSCRALDRNGREVPLDPLWGNPRFDLRPLDGWVWADEEGGVAVGARVGDYEARCSFSSLGLRSQPGIWTVSPGQPKRVITRVDTPDVSAGDVVTARCRIFDDYDNAIEPEEVSWTLDPPLFDLEIGDGGSARFEPTRVGGYHISCALAESMGAEITPASVQVTPGLPAALSATFVGGRQLFAVGDLVEISPEVVDQYDNLITGVEVEIQISPQLPRFGNRRFYAERSGLYTLTISVIGDTLYDLPLEVRRFFTVEDGAPRITCEHPQVGEQMMLSSVEVSGRVLDLSEISRFTVNGSSVSLDAQGRFTTRITPTWGLNVVELIAEDALGAESLERCMFFASGLYLSEDRAITDAALLHLSQDAIDDGTPRSPINSLGDLLGEMLNSSELVDTIDDALSAQNPIVPTQCRFDTFLGCAFSAGARYESLDVGGVNSISLRLISGGVSVDAVVRNVTVGMRTTGTLSQGGEVSLSSARVVAELDISLSGGVPRVSVRGNPTVTLGNIDLDLDISFSIARSVINAVLNLILGAFEDLITDQLSDTLESYITDEVDNILSTALNSLDLSSIGLNLNLPRPFGAGAYRLGLNFSLNRLDVNSSRLRIGMSSQVSGARNQLLSINGVPSPTGLRRVELSPGFTNDAAGSAHVTILNSILTRLWRGKYFDVTTLPEMTGGEAELQLQLLVPPAVQLDPLGNGATLHFGPAVAEIEVPALFDEPIILNLGGIASSSISLVGNTFSFNQIRVDQLFLSSPGFVMSEEGSAAIEDLLIGVVQSLLDEALNTALPSFPVPDFALPNSLSVYGVPRGTRLGVRDLSLTQDGARLIGKGDLR